jgi:predicted DNA-binding transcriptional regulator AlpA
MSDRADPTFSDLAAYGSAAWVAARLGLSLLAFNRKREALDRDGFPPRDRITGGWLKQDVDRWIAHRATVPPVRDTLAAPATREEPNYAKL